MAVVAEACTASRRLHSCQLLLPRAEQAVCAAAKFVDSPERQQTRCTVHKAHLRSASASSSALSGAASISTGSITLSSFWILVSAPRSSPAAAFLAKPAANGRARPLLLPLVLHSASAAARTNNARRAACISGVRYEAGTLRQARCEEKRSWAVALEADDGSRVLA